MDAVVIGSALTVVISIVILAFIGFKIKGLMDRDADKRK